MYTEGDDREILEIFFLNPQRFGHRNPTTSKKKKNLEIIEFYTLV